MTLKAMFALIVITIITLLGSNAITWYLTRSSVTDRLIKEKEEAVQEKDAEWRLKLSSAKVESTGTVPVILQPAPEQDVTVHGAPEPIGNDQTDSAGTAELPSLPWDWTYEDSLRKVSGKVYPDSRTARLKIVDKPRRVEVPVLRSTVLQVDTVAPDRQKWYWNDGTLNADYVWSGSLEAGLSFSLFTWSEGGKYPNAVIMRLPEIGISGNFNDRGGVFVGARLNVGHYLPVLQDLYISGKYSYDYYVQNWEPKIGIGTGI